MTPPTLPPAWSTTVCPLHTEGELELTLNDGAGVTEMVIIEEDMQFALFVPDTEYVEVVPGATMILVVCAPVFHV